MGSRIFKYLCLIILLTFLPLNVFAGGSTATSGVTAQDIIDDVRGDVNEDSEGFLNDSELVGWINEAIWEIVARTGCLESGASNVILKDSVRQYDMSASSFFDVSTVEYDSGNTDDPREGPQIYTLDRVSKKDIGHNKETGDPKVYCVWNDVLEIWPIPRSSQTGNTLYVYFIDFPSGVSLSTNSIETPAYFDTAIKHYVAYRAYKKEATMQEHAEASKALFEESINLYIQNVLRREAFIDAQ